MIRHRKKHIILLLWAFAAFAVVIAARVKAKQMDKDCALKAVRRDTKEIMGSDDARQRLRDKMKEMLEKTREHTTGIEALTDKTIKEFGIKTLIGTGVMLVLLCIPVTDTAYKQKEFWIYSDSNYTYAVAYQDGNHCVLKQATLNGDEIIIHTGEQLVVSGNVATSQKTFDKVTFEE